MLKTTIYVIEREAFRIEAEHHHGAGNVRLKLMDKVPGPAEAVPPVWPTLGLLLPPDAFDELKEAFEDIQLDQKLDTQRDQVRAQVEGRHGKDVWKGTGLDKSVKEALPH